MKPEKEFKIGNFISVKLERGKTVIYVAGKLIRNCEFLLINIPKNDVNNTWI